MAEKTKAQLAEELAASEKKAEALAKRIAAAEAKVKAAEAEVAAAVAKEKKETATTPGEPRKKRRRTLQERLGEVRAGGQMKEGEHMMDLVLVRNNTGLDQVVTTDDERRIKLLARGITDKSAVMADKSGDPDSADLEEFKGGTVVLTRKLAVPLVAHGVAEIVSVVDVADPDDYEEDE